MHQANRLAGTGGHYRVKEKAVAEQDKGTVHRNSRTGTWEDETGGQEAVQEGQSPACTNRF